MNRRTLITGFAALLAAPAVVRASALMPIDGDVYRVWEWRSVLLPSPLAWERCGFSDALFNELYKSPRGNFYEGIWTFFGKDRNIYSDKPIGFRKVELFHACRPTKRPHRQAQGGVNDRGA